MNGYILDTILSFPAGLHSTYYMSKPTSTDDIKRRMQLFDRTSRKPLGVSIHSGLFAKLDSFAKSIKTTRTGVVTVALLELLERFEGETE